MLAYISVVSFKQLLRLASYINGQTIYTASLLRTPTTTPGIDTIKYVVTARFHNPAKNEVVMWSGRVSSVMHVGEDKEKRQAQLDRCNAVLNLVNKKLAGDGFDVAEGVIVYAPIESEVYGDFDVQIDEEDKATLA